MTTLLDRIRSTNSEVAAIRKELAKMENYYTVPYEEMYQYYSIMPNKQADKFIEGWIAHLIGGHKMDSTLVPEEIRARDNGDIWLGETLQIGINNIELKCTFRDAGNIGGKQFRFYENVPYYLIFKAWDATRYEMFLLTKAQLVNEIIERARDGNRSAFISSQKSNYVSRMSQEQKIQCLLENAAGRLNDQITWEFNAKTETDLYAKFQTQYLVQPNQVKNLLTAKS